MDLLKYLIYKWDNKLANTISYQMQKKNEFGSRCNLVDLFLDDYDHVIV